MQNFSKRGGVGMNGGQNFGKWLKIVTKQWKE